MEMFCPDCMTAMASPDGQTAVCPAHGASFQILFARYPVAAPAVAQVPAGFAVPMAGRAPPAIGGGMSNQGYIPPSSDTYAANLNAAFGGPALLDATCIKHPESPAVARCHTCGSAVCATWDFLLPGGIHLCPPCVTNPKPQVSPRRKGLIRWSVGLAIVTIICTILMFVLAANAHTAKDAEALGVIFQFLTLFPAIVGAALGVSCFDRRLKTPGIAWFGLIGNGLVIIIWLLLIVKGLSM